MNDIIKQFKVEIDELEKLYPSIEVLTNIGMKERHWKDIKEIMGVQFDNNEVTLQEIVNKEVIKFFDKINEISERATKEYTLEKTLMKMTQEWAELRFGITIWKDTGLSILRGAEIEEIQQKLDEHIISAQMIRTNPYVKPIKEEAKSFEKKLVFLQDSIELWTKVQANFLYLDPIFSSEDISKKLPDDAMIFGTIRTVWKGVMAQLEQDTMAIRLERIDNLLDKLKRSNKDLDKISKNLSEYLEMKRLRFPRFFFLSDDELLEILGETKKPQKIQPHLKKCFEGISELVFTDSCEITAMQSSEG